MMSGRQAYYAAVRELGTRHDVLQTQIGFFAASVQEIRHRLKHEVPDELNRFDEAVALARRQLCKDIGGKGEDE